MRAWVGLLALGACGTAPAPTPHNRAPVSDVEVAPGSFGWLGFATASVEADAHPIYAPVVVDVRHPVVTLAAHDELPVTMEAIGARGERHEFRRAALTRIQYGCDGNELEVTPLEGPRIAPGAVWILPPGRPSSWRPTALPVAARGTAPDRRAYAVGADDVVVQRTDANHGTLAVRRDGRQIYRAAFERQVMDGADRSPIDLAEGGPGIPRPVAAWSTAPGGPILIVLLVPGYEGSNLEALLVEDTSARVVEGLSAYLYHCAF